MDKLARTLKIGCIQLKVGANKTENVARALEKIREASMKGAELVTLPGNLPSITFDSRPQVFPRRMFQLAVRHKFLPAICRVGSRRRDFEAALGNLQRARNISHRRLDP